VELACGSNKGRYPAEVIRETPLRSNNWKYPAEVMRGNTQQR
jgi:hypothetical protein